MKQSRTVKIEWEGRPHFFFAEMLLTLITQFAKLGGVAVPKGLAITEITENT